MLDIPNGGIFQCLAATWLVHDNAGEPALSQKVEGAATCADRGPRTWRVAPATTGGNIPNNVLLRELASEAGSSAQQTWLINKGEIQSIPDGGTYLCLAYANPVIWDVRYTEAAAWTPVGTAASCGKQP